jgi:hypothetical protein
MSSVTPVAKGVTICDYHFGTDTGKVDLYGLFNAIRPIQSYPVSNLRFCLFTQLTNGLGNVPFQFDISNAQTGNVVWSSGIRTVTFQHRFSIVQIAYLVENSVFTQPGLYLVELFCNNVFVCDTVLELLPSKGMLNGKHHPS